MKRHATQFLLAAAIVAVTGNPGAASLKTPLRRCAPDAIAAGTVCLDKYEATVWRVPDPTTANAFLVNRIRQGNATRAELEAGGATQVGAKEDDYAPCADDGQNCTDDIYAVSLPMEIPSANITWFQAVEACANSAKRLPTNAEWQVGANGRPDPGPDDGETECNSATNAVSLTGSRGSCVSARGAFDMVGNLDEWVADWVPLSTSCPNWGSFSDDFMCLAGAGTTNGTGGAASGPGALLRGGDFFQGRFAGPLTVFGTFAPSRSEEFVGFRCAR